MNENEIYTNLIEKLNRAEGENKGYLKSILNQNEFIITEIGYQMEKKYPLYQIEFLKTKIDSKISLRYKYLEHLQIQIATRSDNKSLFRISMKNVHYLRLFSIMVSDFEMKLHYSKSDEILNTLLDTLDEWSSLFKIKHGMSEEKLLGLIGELMFFIKLVESGHAPNIVLNSWNGPEGNSKDFNFGKKQFEIKFSKKLPEIKISSEFQLETNDTDKLYLVVYCNSSDAETITLNNLIENIKSKLEIELDIIHFTKKLLKYGFNPELDTEDIGNRNYQPMIYNTYWIRDGFPRITRNNSLKELYNIRYFLSAESVNDFRVNIDDVKKEKNDEII